MTIEIDEEDEDPVFMVDIVFMDLDENSSSLGCFNCFRLLMECNFTALTIKPGKTIKHFFVIRVVVLSSELMDNNGEGDNGFGFVFVGLLS